MAWSVDEALDDDLVRVIERDDAKGVYVLTFGDLKTKVKITLRKGRGKQTAFTQSHAAKTPLQAGPYWTSLPGDQSPGDALHKAISGITMYFRQAIEKGHKPSEDWLVLA
jgi:hypothetical protein